MDLSAEIKKLVQDYCEYKNLEFVNLETNCKFYRTKNKNSGLIYYSKEYNQNSKIADSSYVAFNWKSELMYGQIHYFVDLTLNGTLQLCFAVISPLEWKGKNQLHLHKEMGRLLTDNIDEKQKYLTVLEDLKEIIGLFPVKISNKRNVSAVINFSF